MNSPSDRREISPTAAPSQGAGWAHFAHDADMGVRGFGPTPASAFEQAALAVTALITSEPVRPLTTVTVRCAAPDLEVLLVDWLNALVYEMATRKMLFGRFRVQIRDHELEAQAWGEPVDVSRHACAVEVKGATFTALEVAADDDGQWHAQCVVDV